MTSIADQFKEKIEQGKLPEPIPRWRVQVRHVLLWILFGSFVVIGTASSGVAVWFMTDPSGLLMEYNNGDALSSILDALPLFWIILSLILAVGAISIFVHAPRGYRYRTVVIGGSVALAFIAFGGAISATGMSDRIESAASRMPGYSLIQRPRLNQFIKIEQNRIIGRIQESQNGHMMIQDPGGIIWQVDVRQCDLRQLDFVEQGNCVRIIGMPSSTVKVFEAKELLPCPRGVRIQRVQQYMKEQVKEPLR
ncbi:MAG: hypothetical protein P1P90_00245 [Patescibacteria group bacterium]|nr:hypothetical protein [Patescibacteria group bacterium]